MFFFDLVIQSSPLKILTFCVSGHFRASLPEDFCYVAIEAGAETASPLFYSIQVSGTNYWEVVSSLSSHGSVFVDIRNAL